MLRTAEIDKADSVKPSDIDVFLSDAAWAIRSTYHTVLKASPGAAIFGQDMLFDIPFIADWKKIGERRQLLTDRNTARENEGRIDYDYQVGLNSWTFVMVVAALDSPCHKQSDGHHVGGL